MNFNIDKYISEDTSVSGFVDFGENLVDDLRINKKMIDDSYIDKKALADKEEKDRESLKAEQVK
jgi:hypothetical protein